MLRYLVRNLGLPVFDFARDLHLPQKEFFGFQTNFFYAFQEERKFFKSDEAGDTVSLREPGALSFTVSLDTAVKIGGHSGVQRAITLAGQDVDEIIRHPVCFYSLDPLPSPLRGSPGMTLGFISDWSRDAAQ